MRFADSPQLTNVLENSIDGRKNGTAKLRFSGNLEVKENQVEKVIERKMLEIGNYSSIVTVVYDGTDDNFSLVFLVFNKNKTE